MEMKSQSGASCHLRPVQDADIPAIRLLVNTSYKELADMGLNYTATYQDEATTRKRIDEGRAFVLELNQEIIGTVLFSTKNYFTQRNTGFVSQLAIDPQFKKSGLGSKLMDYCEELARAEGFEAVQLDTAKPARHLVDWYLRRGYAIVGETRWEGKTYESWVFEKRVVAIDAIRGSVISPKQGQDSRL
jgi:predicted N-acetyltransferase YhbS